MENKATIETNTDFETRSLDTMCLNESSIQQPWWHNFKYSAAGILFGIALYKGEARSWFRIQEMFRFESFHMYGIIGTAVIVGMISVFIIKKFNIKTMNGETIVFPKKKLNKGNIIGALLFGLGWGITGACPGPLYVQIGAGYLAVIVTLLSAILGTWVYGYFRDKLPM